MVSPVPETLNPTYSFFFFLLGFAIQLDGFANA